MRDMGMLYLILYQIYPFAMETVREIQGDWERLCEFFFRVGQKCSKRSAPGMCGAAFFSAGRGGARVKIRRAGQR